MAALRRFANEAGYAVNALTCHGQRRLTTVGGHSHLGVLSRQGCDLGARSLPPGIVGGSSCSRDLARRLDRREAWRRLDEGQQAAYVSAGAVAGAEAVPSLDPDEWCAFYINLARRPDRREKLLGKLARSNDVLLKQIRRVDAIDGKFLEISDDVVRSVIDEGALDRAKKAQRRGAYTIIHEGGRLVHFDNHFTAGGVACAMSHRRALELIADHPTAEWGLILEDDVCGAMPRADRVIADVLRKLPDDWDAVFLGYHDNMGAVHRDDGGTFAPDVDVSPLRWPLFGLFAWVVRKGVARQMVDQAFPISGQVDHALSSWLIHGRGRSYYVRSDHMVFFSPKSEDAEDSDIQTMLKVGELVKKYHSFEGYYNHVWGLDAMLEEYVNEGLDPEEAKEYAELLGGDAEHWDFLDFLRPDMHMGYPPPDAPAPDCPSADWFEN